MSRKFQIMVAMLSCIATVSCEETPEYTPTKKPEVVVRDSSYVVRVMQFNILMNDSEQEGHKWYDDRKEPCLKMLRRVNPDVVALEEVRLPQQNDLIAAFPEYTSVQFPKNGNKNGVGQRNMIMWKKDAVEMLDWGKFWFSKDRTSNVGTNNSNLFDDPDATQKMVVYAKFKQKATGKVFWVFSAHFFAVKSLETKAHCVDICLESIREKVGSSGTVFLCGDLNLNYSDESTHSTLQPLFDYMKWSALEAPKSHGVNRATYNRFGVGTSAILDYIFYRGATAINYFVEDNHVIYGAYYISDHYPIYSDFLLPE